MPKFTAVNSTASRNTIDRFGIGVSAVSSSPIAERRGDRERRIEERQRLARRKPARRAGAARRRRLDSRRVTTWMAMSWVRRTSSCGNERRSSSLKKPPRERPMTIWVTFSNLAKRSSSAGRSLPVSVCVSAPRLSASFMASSSRWRAASSRLAPGRSTVTAIQGASIRSARRLAVRTTVGEIGSGPMQARMRSPAAHGPSIACACMRSIRSASMRSAARRSASSRKRRQVLRLEETFDGAGGGVLNIDLSFREALEQLVGRKVDQHDLVGLVEHRVGHGLAHAHLGDLQHDVVEAFEMLDVERGPDVDAGRQQFVDVLPALGMAAAGHVGVGVFVDQQQARPARQRRVEIELLHDLVAVDDRLARQDLEAFDQLLGLAAAVGLDQARRRRRARPTFSVRAAVSMA